MKVFKKDIRADRSGAMNSFITSMIGAVLIIVVGVLFLPMIQDQVTFLTVASEANDMTPALSGVAASLFGQVPLFYVLGLVFVAIAWIILATKEM